MLTAIEETTNQVIFISDWEDRLNELREKKLSDIFYNKPVFVRHSHTRKNSFVRSHFVSKAVYQESLPENVIFDDEYITLSKNGKYRCNESIWHIAGKQLIQKWAFEEFSEQPLMKVIPEYRVPIESKGDKYRVIDVALLFPSGQIFACECQLSPITVEQLEERIYDYRSEGIDSMWFFGDKACTEANIIFTEHLFGEHCRIEFETETIRTHFQSK